MKIRPTISTDIPQVMEIYQAARDFQREVLGLFQWADNYPSQAQLLMDIEQGGSYVVVKEDRDPGEAESGMIVGTFFAQEGPDDIYLPLRSDWSDVEDITTIHRIAGNGQLPKMGNQLFSWLQANYPILMIDTHKDNLAMQQLIKKFDFEYLGDVTIHDGTLRNTFIWQGQPDKAN